MWTSPYAQVEVGGTTLHRMVLEAAARFGDRPALVDWPPRGRGSATGCWPSASRGVAAGLAERGLGARGTCWPWGPRTCLQWAGVALGAMAAGGAVTGASPACTERELAAQLADAGASVLVTVPQLVPAARSAAAAAGVGRGGRPRRGRRRHPRPRPARRRRDAAAGAPRPTRPPRSALLPYSSGTTGLPKGVLLTHANLVTVGPPGRQRAARRPGATRVLARAARSSTSWGSLVTLAVPLCVGRDRGHHAPLRPRASSSSCWSGTGSPSSAVPRPMLRVLAAPPAGRRARPVARWS